MDEKEIILLVTSSAGAFLIISIGIVYLVVTFFKTKQGMLQEKTDTQIKFAQELNNTKLEIQDQTLTYVGRELHDNIGQLLTVAKIHSNSLMKSSPDDKKVNALDDALSKTFTELKQLSKSLDSSRIAGFGFHRELQAEIERINNAQKVQVTLQITGTHETDNEKAIIIYRMLQEFMTNSVKYSGEGKVDITLTYTADALQVIAHDSGTGFDITTSKDGSGLRNIKNRAALLQAKEFLFESAIGKGTTLSFSIPLHP